VSARWAWSTSTPWTSPTCSARSSTAPPTSGGASSIRPATGSRHQPRRPREAFPVRLTAENARDIAEGFDLIVDGTDNFATRYLVNDLCVLLGVPNVFGSIFRFDGQASVFATAEGPCYRCLYRSPPPAGLVPACAEGGVLGVLPGIVGTIQATEAIKLITGAGTPLIGRLLLIDALHWHQRTVRLRRDPEYPACGRAIRDLTDAVCSTPPDDVDALFGEVPEIQPVTLSSAHGGDTLDIVDVREPHEWAIASMVRGYPMAALGAAGRAVPGSGDRGALQGGPERPAVRRSGPASSRCESRRRHPALEPRGGSVRSDVLRATCEGRRSTAK
jgi:hypothetical protein